MIQRVLRIGATGFEPFTLYGEQAAVLVPKTRGGRFLFIYKGFGAFWLGFGWFINISCGAISGCSGRGYGSAWGQAFWVRLPFSPERRRERWKVNDAVDKEQGCETLFPVKDLS